MATFTVAVITWRKRSFDKKAAQLQSVYDRVRAVEAAMDTLGRNSALAQSELDTLETLRIALRDDARR